MASVPKRPLTAEDHYAATHADAIVAWYAHAIGQALGEMYSRELVLRAIAAAARAKPFQEYLKAAMPQPSGAQSGGAGAGAGGQQASQPAVMQQVQQVLNNIGNVQQLQQVLDKLKGDAYIAGAVQAHAQTGAVSAAFGHVATDLPADFWDTWTPGYKGAGDKIINSGGLDQLLAYSGQKIAGMQATTVDKIGAMIAQGLANGDPHVLIAQKIDTLVQDPRRSLTIANTEFARAMTQASLDTYASAGVQKVDWVAEDTACPLCLDNEAASPAAPGDFPNGDVPAHPNCRCAMVPHDPLGLLNAGDEEAPGGLEDLGGGLDELASRR